MTKRKPRVPHRRSTDRKPTFVDSVRKYAQTLVSLALAVGVVVTGLNHFATAGDVDTKFKVLRQEIRQSSLDQQIATMRSERQRYDDKLFELRAERNPRKNQPTIQRYESLLQDTNQRLRDLELKKLEGQK